MKDHKARELITEAAAILIQEGGAGHLTLSDVAHAAHMTDAEVRSHFPTMDDLVIAMAGRLADTFYGAVAEACKDDESAKGWLRAFVETGFALDESGDMSRIARALLCSTAFRPHFIDAFREREVEVRGIFPGGGVNAETVVIVRTTMDGIFFGRMFGLEHMPDEMSDAVRMRLLDMIGEDD